MIRAMCHGVLMLAVAIAIGCPHKLWCDDHAPQILSEQAPPTQKPAEATSLEDPLSPAADEASAIETPADDGSVLPFNDPSTGLPETTHQPPQPPDQPDTAEIEPNIVRALTPIRPGHNDANPIWSPNGEFLAFERAVGEKREIVIADRKGTIARTIYVEVPKEKDSMAFFFPGITEEVSFNAGLSWSPDGRKLAFMSNGGSGNYDLYLLPDLESSETIRLTSDPGKDSHPHWSSVDDRLLFVSGRTGKANIFSLQLNNRSIIQLTQGRKMFLYPQWSPDGRQVAMIYGSNENHDIYLISDTAHPYSSLKPLTTWPYDDLRPIWSPDGSKLAFYSNYNKQNDPKRWSLLVVAADGSDPTEGEALAAHVVAVQVIPDVEKGPAWIPDSRHIVYVKDDEQAFHPIFLVDTESKEIKAIKTGTKMNHDITCAPDGTLAFRAQVEQWDHIYIAELDMAPQAPEGLP